MSFTYTLLFDTTAIGLRNQVRLAMGDTDESRQLAQDEEIAFWLAQNGNSVGPTAVQGVRSLLARFASRPDSQSSVEGAVNWAGIKDRLEGVLRHLFLQFGAGMPRGGGISITDIDGYDTDTDIPVPAFDESGPGNAISADNPARLDIPPGLEG